MNVGAYIGWVCVVLAVTLAVQHGITGLGSLYATFIASIILSETAFVQEG